MNTAIRKIRQIALRLVVALVRIAGRPGPAGWSRSTRPPTLHGR
ncbi:MAG TPA: hypothetical protein VG936_12720 [Lacunisphaera sp.]|nr:hypothetical protein [Lacunisphaera sp.]